MAVTIASSVGASMSAATGRPGQGHLCYAVNQGAWWLLYLTSTQALSALYSSNFSSWSAPTGSPFSLAFAHGSEGRSFGFSYANIASTDVLHMVAGYGSSGANHARFSLGTTWSNTSAESQLNANVYTPNYCVTAMTSSNVPVDLVDSSGGDQIGYVGSNADAGTSWTAGFGGYAAVYDGEANHVGSSALFSLGSGSLLSIGSNSGTTWTQLEYDTFSSGSWSNAGGTAVLGSTVTGTDPNNWGAVARTTSDIHVVALSDNSSSYVHERFNGSSWSGGSTIASLAYQTTSGIPLVSDGTSVWAFAFDTSKNLQYTKWTSGGGWSAWSVLEATRSNTPSYLTACYSAAKSLIGVAWIESTGSNYNIIGSSLSTSGGGATPWLFLRDQSSSSFSDLGI